MTDSSQTNPKPGNPRVVQTHGQTPRLWPDRNVIFFANVLAGFFENEELSALLKKEISGADSYGGRLLPIMGLLYGGGKNLLVLEREPEAALTGYFKDVLKLNLPQVALLTHDEYVSLGRAQKEKLPLPFPERLRVMQDHPAQALDGYVTDRIIASLAIHLGKSTISSPQGSKLGNNKLLLHQHLEKSGLPVFETRLAAGPGEVAGCLKELAGLGYTHAGVKSQIGASGIGLMKVATTGAGEAVPELFFHEGPCMVQGWVSIGLDGVTSIHSPSVQMFLDEKSVYLYDLTEQILSQDSIHQGNESPPPYLDEFDGLQEELFRQAGVAGSWLHAQGYRGTASVDFLVATLKEKGACRVYACEINARVTGATYPSILARHYSPSGSWLMRNLKLTIPLAGSTILKLLEDHGHLFQPERKDGILPINFNLTPEGLVEKGQFLCLGEDSAGCHAMLRKAEEDLPLAWEYVRD
ncbi:hypothetical protein WJU23_07515 [Prosthecobacter sp. SYSU 5D2]|uniref:hypothetical protein n=1 Tax=Prosthecobacter sp. SYSU 5D2 TaxID=3134134 RepID=UPI0031FE44DF